MSRPTVFISYSHRDEEWKDLIRTQLSAIALGGDLDFEIWDDRAIDGGSNWYDEIREAMLRADLAVLLVSADFLASKFVHYEEVPYLLQRHQSQALPLLPILIKPCPWRRVRWLRELQIVPRDGLSLSEDLQDRLHSELSAIAEHAVGLLERNSAPTHSEPESPAVLVDIERLPVSGHDVFGRETELDLLDGAWDDGALNAIALVGWGGIGKSTLIRTWLNALGADRYRGARRVFGWSFYRQGVGKRITSADLFISEALRWFADDAPDSGSPWDKAERLARRIQSQRTLLILDGMEPLQSNIDIDHGRISDPALSTLILELARSNPGLCVITTRTPVPELERTNTQEVNLEHISPGAGRAILRVHGVRGNDDDLEHAAHAFGNHALAINLLARYISDRPEPTIDVAATIPDLALADEGGRHARRVLRALEAWLGDGSEVEMLRTLGLFDRPVEVGALAAVMAPPAIPDLTTRLSKMTEGGRQDVFARLRALGVVAPRERDTPALVDAHPIIREEYAERLRNEFPKAWQAGNERLYQYFRHSADPFPETLEAMSPLYLSLIHGARARRHERAFREVYQPRILRATAHFSSRRLGAFSADLAALSEYFETLWDQPVSAVSPAIALFLLGEVGYNLLSLGRVSEAIAPMRSAYSMALELRDWEAACVAACNISEVEVARGELQSALTLANAATELTYRTRSWQAQLLAKVAMGAVQHQLGDVELALAAFESAEVLQRGDRKRFPLLSSIQGFHFCELLLEQGRHAEVISRCEQILNNSSGAPLPLLAVPMGHLSLAAALDEVGHQARAQDHAQRAITGLYRANKRDYLPKAHIICSRLARARGDLSRAQSELDTALRLASDSGLRLHVVDGQIEQARLCLSNGDVSAAARSVREGEALATSFGYRRRLDELVLLKQVLSQ